MNLIVLYLGSGVAIGFAAGAAFAGAMMMSQRGQRQAIAASLNDLRQQING